MSDKWVPGEDDNLEFNPFTIKLNFQWFYARMKQLKGISRFRFLTYATKKAFEKHMSDWFYDYMADKFCMDNDQAECEEVKCGSDSLYEAAMDYCNNKNIEIIYKKGSESEFYCDVHEDTQLCNDGNGGHYCDDCDDEDGYESP